MKYKSFLDKITVFGNSSFNLFFCRVLSNPTVKQRYVGRLQSVFPRKSQRLVVCT